MLSSYEAEQYGAIFVLARGEERRYEHHMGERPIALVRRHGARWTREGWTVLVVSTPETIFLDLQGRAPHLEDGVPIPMPTHAGVICTKAGYPWLVPEARRRTRRASDRARLQALVDHTGPEA